MKVAAIVPAHNEATRIAPVLEALHQASLVDEIIVVNDGSMDETSSVVSGHPYVKLVELANNLGKGGAMVAGASSTDADVVLFLDADLLGMTGELADSIVRPVVEGALDVSIGIFKGGRSSTDLAQVIAPFISGQRAMRRKVFLEIPDLKGVRSGVEVAMTRFIRANRLKMGTVTLPGCTHVMKEEKLGMVRGSAARIRMYYDICKITIGGSRGARKRGQVIKGPQQN